ncbi:hypothetical protein LINPERHAP2_LOCUS23458, partial [Linum perenne]
FDYEEITKAINDFSIDNIVGKGGFGNVIRKASSSLLLSKSLSYFPRIKTIVFDKGSMQSNLDCFLNFTTPVVESHFLPKRWSEIGNLNRYPWD